MEEYEGPESPDEPQGEWVSAPTLLTTPIVAIALCKFSGNKVGKTGCPDRRAQLHPNESCITVYAQAGLMLAGLLVDADLEHYVTTASAGGERTFRTEVPA